MSKKRSGNFLPAFESVFSLATLATVFTIGSLLAFHAAAQISGVPTSTAQQNATQATTTPTSTPNITVGIVQKLLEMPGHGFFTNNTTPLVSPFYRNGKFIVVAYCVGTTGKRGQFVFSEDGSPV